VVRKQPQTLKNEEYAIKCINKAEVKKQEMQENL
jgi:hypothetical protein